MELYMSEVKKERAIKEGTDLLEEIFSNMKEGTII